MSGYYKQKKSKTRILIPVTIVLGLIALALLTLSIYMSRSTKNVIDLETLELVQLQGPQEGDEICIIHTSLGDIYAKLYPEYAPVTVENFKTLARNGYYDDTFIYNIPESTYFTAGAPNKSGTLNKNLDSGNEEIEMEYSQNLWPLKGAVYSVTTKVDKGFIKTLMNRAKRYGGSRFGICGSIEMTDEIKESLLSSESSKEVGQAFVDKGGIPNFSQQMTIFAQVYDGWDAVDDIICADTEDETNINGYTLPKEDIKIKSIEISSYSEK